MLAALNVVTLVGAFAADWWPGWFALAGIASVVYSLAVARARLESPRLGQRSGSPAAAARRRAGRRRGESRPPRHGCKRCSRACPRPARRRRPASISCGGSSARSSRAATSSSRPSPRCCSGARNARGRSRRGGRQNGPALAGWIAAAGEFEALASLSGYAFEHPNDILPEMVERGPPLRRGGARPSADSRGARGGQRRAAGRRHPRAARLGLEHVGQEHAAPDGRHRRGPRAGGRAGSRDAPSMSPLALGATLRVQDSLQEGTIAVLRRNHAPSRDRRSDGRSDAGAVPAGRTAGRHELSRPARRRGCRREGTRRRAARSAW